MAKVDPGAATATGAGLYFARGVATHGTPAQLRVAGARLLVETAAGVHGVPIAALSCERGGFDSAQLALVWRDVDGDQRVYLDDSTRAAWLRQPPSALADLLAPAAKRIRRTRTRLRAAILAAALVSLAPLLLLVAFWFYADRAVDWVVARVAPATEVALGEQVFAQSTAGLRVLEGGAAAASVHELGRRLADAQPLPYTLKFHLVDNAAVNAFAVPGGHIVIFTGLLHATDSAEELAGVMAHEVQHIALRHSLKGLVRDAGWRAAFALAFGDIAGGVAGSFAQELASLKFSRDQESDADRHGLALLQRAGIDARGMPRFFDKLALKEAVPVGLLSTHPMSSERSRRLRELMAQDRTYPPPLPYDWAAIKASLPAAASAR